MTSEEISPALLAVAPVRERGLKYTDADIRYLGHNGRSREGAWIEILTFFDLPPAGTGSLP